MNRRLMRTCAVVNPVAGGGRVRRIWPQMEPRLHEATSSLVVRPTRGPRTATSITRDALNDGFERIVAIGGDGTLHEVVNGFFDDSTAINPSAVLAHVACGSGSDFRRSLGAPVGLPAVDQLSSERIDPFDVLRLEVTQKSGGTSRHYVINVASFGLSGTVVRRFSQVSSVVPTWLRYLWGAVRSLLTTGPTRVQLTLDDEPLGPVPLHLVAIANGHCFASGLPIAPGATPQDGHFDVTLLHAAPVLALLRRVHRFYRGTHPPLECVNTYRGRHLQAHPLNDTQPVWLEADGEALGQLPATFSIVPDAIRIQY